MPTMTLWDIAAGILIGGGLILGILWGARHQGERAFFWISAVFAAAIIIWRAGVWHDAYQAQREADRLAHDPAALYAKYGIAPVRSIEAVDTAHQ